MSVQYGLGSVNISNGEIKISISCLNGNPEKKTELPISSKATFIDGSSIKPGSKALVVLTKDGKIDETKIAPWMSGNQPNFKFGGIGKGVVLDVNQDPYEGLNRNIMPAGLSAGATAAEAAPPVPKAIGIAVSWVDGMEFPDVLVNLGGELEKEYHVGDTVFFFAKQETEKKTVAYNVVIAEGDCL